ncbi:MAG: chloride channel protein [Neisseriaceae bacterium]|nr:MAG: chloride channel protein [Neisseriaceae bacterium]
MKFKHYNRLIYYKFNLKFVMLAVIIGLISVFFVKAVEFAYSIFLYLEPRLGWWLIVYVPSIMLVIIFLLRRFFPEAEGSGIPQALAISQMSEAKIDSVFALRSILSKILLIFLGTLSGGTLGREGATVQIGATVMNQLGRKLSLPRRRVMLIVGAAAGLASAFNTPLGGIVFAFEELIKSPRSHIGLLKIAAIAISGIVTIYFLGNYSYFGRVERDLLFFNDWVFLVAIIIGVIAGLISVVFAKIVRWFSIDDTLLTRWRRNNPYKNAVYCGVLVALIGLASGGLSFGNGYHESKLALDGQLILPPSYVLYKLLSALFTTNAGIPGGYFATSLAIGNGIGGLFHHFCMFDNPQQYYLLGMVAFLAALTRAPATAIIMVIQVSSSQVFTLPLIVAALSATLIGNLFGKGIYEYQIARYLS